MDIFSSNFSVIAIFVFLCFIPIIYNEFFSLFRKSSSNNFGDEFVTSSDEPKFYNLCDICNIAASNKCTSKTYSKIKIVWLIKTILHISLIIFIALNLTSLVNFKDVGLIVILMLSINPISNKLTEKFSEKESVSK